MALTDYLLDWWGFEVAMPPPTLVWLSVSTVPIFDLRSVMLNMRIQKAPSIARSVINVLTALSVVNDGVREILPFVRYISSFIDGEWDMIKQQDHGKGVVCAATW